MIAPMKKPRGRTSKRTNDLGTAEHNQSLYFYSVVQSKDPRTINRMELHRKSGKKTGLYGGTINDSVCFETPSPLKDTCRPQRVSDECQTAGVAILSKM